ncbi:MAG: alpha/beta fold hydrolase [Gemmatimonadota bacterium]
MTTSWFLTLAPRPEAPVRLFCLPYAGGSAAVYREWGKKLHDSIEVSAVELPGRGWRLKDPPLDDLHALADLTAHAIALAVDRPFALFGHSMGAWLALLVARCLEERALTPTRLVVSGRQAPSMGSTTAPLSHLDDDAFVDEVENRYGAMPRQIMDDPDLRALFLPTLRADIRALEGYQHDAGRPLPCPITAWGGEDDALVPRAHLELWSEETASTFDCRTFPGRHFYFQPDPTAVLATLDQVVGVGASPLPWGTP